MTVLMVCTYILEKIMRRIKKLASWEDRLAEINHVIMQRAIDHREFTQEDKDYIIELSEFAKIAIQTEMLAA